MTWRWIQVAEDTLDMRKEVWQTVESVGQAMKRATLHKEPATKRETKFISIQKQN